MINMLIQHEDYNAYWKQTQIEFMLKILPVSVFWDAVLKVDGDDMHDFIEMNIETLSETLEYPVKRTFKGLSKEEQIDYYCKINGYSDLDEWIQMNDEVLYTFLKNEIVKHLWVKNEMAMAITLEEFQRELFLRTHDAYAKPIIERYLVEYDVTSIEELSLEVQLELFRVSCPVRL